MVTIFFEFIIDFVSFVIFTYRKLRAEKNEKFSFLCRSTARSKRNLRKCSIYRESLKFETFPTKSLFKNVSMTLLLISCKLNKMNILTLIAHSSKTIRIKKKQILKFSYQKE